jgi:hypothetical protein
LVDTNKDDKLDIEIAKRLDDLFGEGDASSDEKRALKADDPIVDENKSPDQHPAAADDEIFELENAVANETDAERTPVDYPLAELKNLVLSIDWEITDEVLSGFLSQIDGLKNGYKNDKIILMFLQLLGSLGEYIKTNRGKAHPKTFKILNSAFSRLEDVVQKEDMAESEKKKLLKAESENRWHRKKPPKLVGGKPNRSKRINPISALLKRRKRARSALIQLLRQLKSLSNLFIRQLKNKTCSLIQSQLNHTTPLLKWLKNLSNLFMPS